MTVADFWKLIDSTRKSDPEAHVESLVARLAKLGEPEILSFGHHWHTLHGQAYQWLLWGAAYILNGGCSDDGFTDFRSWLLLQGQTVYDAALKDPDSLAKLDLEMDEACCECYPAPEAYEHATGKKGDAYYAALSKTYPDRTQAEEPAGEEWDFDNEEQNRERLPKLVAKFEDE